MTIRMWPFAEADVGTYSETFQRNYINVLWGSFPTLDGNLGVRYGLDVNAQSPASTSVNVNSGAAMINGQLFHSDATATVNLSANSSGQPRVDCIVARSRLADLPSPGSFAAIAGTPSATPVPPTLVQNSSEWQIPLAYVYLASGYSSISSSVIVDVREPFNRWEQQIMPIGIILPILQTTSMGGKNAVHGSFLYADGNTIGNANSGSTSLADKVVWKLFELLWTVTDNTRFPIQDSSGTPTTRGSTALADWVADKRMPLPDMRGRAPVGMDAFPPFVGTSANRITASWADAVGGSGGSQDHQLTVAELPAHSHGGIQGLAGSGAAQFAGGGSQLATNISSQGSDQAHNNIQPSYALPYVVKFRYAGL